MSMVEIPDVAAIASETRERVRTALVETSQHHRKQFPQFLLVAAIWGAVVAFDFATPPTPLICRVLHVLAAFSWALPAYLFFRRFAEAEKQIARLDASPPISLAPESHDGPYR